MNPTHWSTHVKHILVALIFAGALIGVFVARGVYESRVADRMAKRDEQISANEVKKAQSQKANQTDNNAITARDLQTAVENAALRSRASQPLTPAEVEEIISARLAGANPVKGKDDKGNETVTVGTGYLADTLNKFSINQQICDKNLSTCEADKKNLNDIIGRMTNDAKTDAGTIKLQADQLKDLSKFVVPKNMLFFGVGKTQGTSFQDVNSYQPVIGYGRRLTSRFSVMGFAQNKSAAIGGLWNFGGVPK